MFRCGKPEKSYFSKVFDWFVWVVLYKTSETSIVQAKTFEKRKDAYAFYKTLEKPNIK